MNNSNGIKYNSQELRDLAAYLCRRRRDNEFLAEINFYAGMISSVWQGPAADQFVERLNSMANKIAWSKGKWYSRMANELDAAASELEQSTNNLVMGISNFEL